MAPTISQLKADLLRALAAHSIHLNLPAPAPQLAKWTTAEPWTVSGNAQKPLSASSTSSTADRATAFATSLPELMIAVLAEVFKLQAPERTTTLCSSTLVCRQWRELAQPLLWRCPPSMDTFESQARFASSAASAPRMALRTRCLVLTWYPISRHGQLLRYIALQCPNVSTVMLQRGSATDADAITFEDLDVLSQVLPTFQRLKHLRVDQYDGTTLLDSALVIPPLPPCILPEVTSLNLTGVPCLEVGFGVNLRALHIASWTRLPSARIAAFARACGRLRSLRLQWHVSDDDVCAFVRSCPLLEVLDIIQIRHDASPPATAWISAAAAQLPGLRCLRSNAAAGAADVLALARAAALLETIAFNRLELREEAALVALVRAHRHTLRHVTLINWDAMSVRGVPAGDALLRELARCPRLECLEVDFGAEADGHGMLTFLDGGAVRDASILQLLQGCPKLMRTTELVALVKQCSTYQDLCMQRVDTMQEWEEAVRECEDSVMSW